MVLRAVLLGLPIGVTFLSTVGSVARVDGVSMQPVSVKLFDEERYGNDQHFYSLFRSSIQTAEAMIMCS